MRSQFANDKFLEEIDSGSGGKSEACVFQHQSCPTITLRVIEVGNAACGEAAEDGGVVRLPVSIVALADERIGERIKHSRMFASAPFVKVSRILLEERRQQGAANECVAQEVGV